MDTSAFNDIQAKLDALKDKMEADAAAIKQQKDEIQALRAHVYDSMSPNKYLRSNRRLIISAPEVIIGNVDREGNMYGSSQMGRVILRSGMVQLQATADTEHGGVIESKAANILNIAVDPGIDGQEENLLKNSTIINQARSISIESDNDTDCFVKLPKTDAPGVTIKSDSTLNILAQVENETRSRSITEVKTSLTSRKVTLTAKATELKGKIKMQMAKMELTFADEGLLSWNLPVVGLRTFPGELWKHEDKVAEESGDLYFMLTEYYSVLAELVEVGRKLKALDKMSNDTSSAKGNYKTASTNAVLNITAENINVLSADGDGNVRDNATAGLNVHVPHVKLVTTDAQGALVKDSNIDINTKTFNLSTANAKYNDPKKQDSGDLPAEGDVNIYSKNVLVGGIDTKLSSGKLEEDKLTAGSSIKLRAEKLSVEATDKEGKATGCVKVNAKDLRMRSMDVDPKSGDEKNIASGGQVMLLGEKMFVGSNNKKTKLVQIAGEKVGVMGKDTAEVQQDGKAVVTLSGGNITEGASKLQVDANATISGNAEIKGETKTPKVTSDQVEAKSAFKSPNINDTMGAGVPGAAGSPSAKLTEEDVQ